LTATNRSPIKRVQDLGGVSILHRGLGGYTRRVRSRAPAGKNHGATTPILTNLWESDHTLTQRLGGYCRYQQYGGTRTYRQKTNTTETAIKDSPPRPRTQSVSYEARSTGRLDRAPAPTRTRPARRGASTAPRLRLVRGPLDGAPRPRPIPCRKVLRQRSDPREARPPAGENSDSREPGPSTSTPFLCLPQDKSHSIQCGYLLPPTGMAAARIDVGTIPVSDLTVLPPIP
jgi:hypothetical protein